MTTEIEQDLHDRRFQRAHEIIDDFIMVRHMSARDALIEICGTEQVAEILAGVEHGLYSDALEKAVWEQVKKEIVE